MLDRKSLITGQDVRDACRQGLLTEQTSGLANGYAQANLVILPQEVANEFRQFCDYNPKPCPLLDVTEVGSPVPEKIASGADIRTDIPKYCIWKHGELVSQPTDLTEVWQDDFVGFLLGCSFTFEDAMMKAGLPVRHIELGRNVPMFTTNIDCNPAGRFHGKMVVSMRPLKPADAIRAMQITSQFPAVHGAPIHLGSPEEIGIEDISQPDFGDAVPVTDDETPVFWACGVTPQSVAMTAKPPLMITHSPGCMFVTDVKDKDLAEG
jgi:uncharacterized protein YcsI (UPF0317 family)